jgi:hypothetical protein
MKRIICVCTGDKFHPWFVDNLKYMIDTHSGIEYDEFEVITDNPYNGVFNKLLMFDKFRDGSNLYFDLDIVITGKVSNLFRNDLTLLHAWWRDVWHTPLNSSIISWMGDQSHIHDTFAKDKDEFIAEYSGWFGLETAKKGMDEYIYKHILSYETYGKVCCSIKNLEQPWGIKKEDYNIWLFNQRHFYMTDDGWPTWWKDYFLSLPEGAF